MDWLSAVQQLRRDGRPGVLITVIDVRGHAPRDPGAKMVVGADHLWGSVGGGDLEEAAVRLARAVTGRDRVLLAGYHGWHDQLIGPSPGVPAGTLAAGTRPPTNKKGRRNFDFRRPRRVSGALRRCS